jgi:hypothetical protein
MGVIIMLNNYDYFKSAANQWGVVFKHDNKWMKKNNRDVAVCARFLVDNKIVTYIIVDDKFFDLSYDTQKFVYNHEIGHYHQHNEMRYNDMTIPERELDADAYAKARVGGSKYAVKALQELKQQTFWEGDIDYINKIFNIRINNISRK